MKRAGMRNQCYTCAHLYLGEGNDVGCDEAACIFAGGKSLCPKYQHADSPAMAGYRACCLCKEVKPESEFSRDKRQSGGLSCYCRVCQKWLRLEDGRTPECQNSIAAAIRSLRRGQCLKVSGVTNIVMRTYRSEVKSINKLGWAQWEVDFDAANREVIVIRTR